MLDLTAFEATPLVAEPYPHLIVPGFLTAAARESVQRDYPEIDRPGSFPASELRCGPAFEALLAELEGPALREAMARKFDIDLAGRPTMITVRGRAQAKDGRIHTDSKTKVITVLLYMNGAWEAPGGRLRLLRNGESLDDMVAEVPPDEGTLVAFLVTPHSWHGHGQFVGPRRVIQLNWVADDDVVRHEQARHRFSARIKNLLRLARA
ncbi:MAG TPA: 2OG-Fe(II) oxygenase [Stellaceae bacterium]|nr:2OG-Fe(II) oxygenase [Stellaceae bacterium]